MIKFIFAIGLMIYSATTFANTAVGNGGDVFTKYLETTRAALVQAIRDLKSSPDDQKRICLEQKDLTPQQILECRGLLLSTMDEIMALNSPSNPTQFGLSDQPLDLPDPSGNLVERDAETDLGPIGSILFNFSRVQFMSPFQILMVMAHAFGHKSLYQGGYLQDNPPTPSFTQGRSLLDSMGFAVATYAQSKGIIGEYFDLRDSFSCTIEFNSGQGMNATVGSQRLFFSEKDFDKYETGINLRPFDEPICALDTPTTRLCLSIRIEERTGCDLGQVSGRSTILDIEQVENPLPDGTQAPSKLLSEKVFDHYNPLCDKLPTSLPIDANGIKFSCMYVGSQGLSH
jgi:hypothetical protein